MPRIFSCGAGSGARPMGKRPTTLKTRLWRVPAAGGLEEQVCSEPVDEYNFAVTAKGIYFIPAAGTPLRYSIRFLRFKTGKVENVILLEKSPGLGLTVSPDESWLLYSQYDQEGSDLMLMENFR